MISTAMILAAGLGSRMRPLTDTLPKPLIPVAGVSMLSRTFNYLKTAGISKIVVNTYYLASQIANAVPQGTLISHEESLLDTGGGIKKALPLLGQDPFFVLNGDSVWTNPESLSKMMLAWKEPHMDALLLLINREKAHGYIGKGDFLMTPDGHVSRYTAEDGSPYVYAGVQLLHPRLFDKSPQGAFSLNLLWNQAIEKRRLFGLIHDGEWFHIDTPESLRTYEPIIARLDANT